MPRPRQTNNDCVVAVFCELTGEDRESAVVRFMRQLTGAPSISDTALSACLKEVGWMMTTCDTAAIYGRQDNSVEMALFEAFWRDFQGEGVIFYTIGEAKVGHAVVVRSGGIIFDPNPFAPDTEFIVDHFKRVKQLSGSVIIDKVCRVKKIL